MPIFRQKLIWVLVILSVLSAGGVIAASPAPAASHAKKTVPPPPTTSPAPMMTPAMSPQPDCMTLIYNMTDCLTYVEHGSNATKPDKNCCPELAGMLDMIGIPVAAPAAAISAEAPSTSGMSMAPSTTAEGPAGGKNGALTLTSSCNNLFYLISVLALALLY
ncbi:hypothetical protein Cgig2_015952 [Carnegiea gigantea]|uniref:Bifunctional inhibitor/plant lipid transfer protein/seed storage helical domain-containing protein n=1 Tax=Carnegiea gigantea TaxID=171969 RepID=A0A9Q1KNW4_9CARY|nr:hypothetical protein Cgig2_015952 [Carnegiea gigantea]